MYCKIYACTMDPVWTGSMMHRSSTSLDCLDKEKGRGKKKKKEPTFFKKDCLRIRIDRFKNHFSVYIKKCELEIIFILLIQIFII